MTGAKLRRMAVAFAVVLTLLAAIGCADVEGGDTATADRSMVEPSQEDGKRGEERSGRADRSAGDDPDRDRGAGQDAHERPRRPTAVVSRVVDGDTVELDNGKTVRLIGIDTPEVYGGTECGGAEASAYMERIASGRRVSVRTDPTQDTYDRYGRLLAYLDARGTDLGEAVLRAGWARVYVYDRPFERLPAYRQAGRTARGGDRGIWRSCSASESRSSAPASVGTSAPDKDCSDFTSHNEAQDHLLPGDPHGLDGDGDGVACDSLGSPTPSPAASSGPDKNCSDFASQSEAQQHLTPGDPHGLDGDGDGVACDSLA